MKWGGPSDPARNDGGECGMRRLILTAVALLGAAGISAADSIQGKETEMNSIANDTRIFKIDPAVRAQDIRFRNRFGIELAGHLYLPKGFDPAKKYAAIAVSGPFGAVKEQSSGLYAQELARRGFVTLAFDPSFTGESSGEPRFVASPDLNTEDFSAAVDCLSLLPYVDAEKVGILGICGWGGFALNAAANDPRIKGTAAVTMYDMSRVSANGYFDSMNADGRYELRRQLCAQRLRDAKSGKYDAVICLGTVIRGATSHYDYVCNEASKGIAQVSLATGIPVLFGVVTTENIEQAIERAGTKAGNKGYDCVLSAIEMVQLIRQIEE